MIASVVTPVSCWYGGADCPVPANSKPVGSKTNDRPSVLTDPVCNLEKAPFIFEGIPQEKLSIACQYFFKDGAVVSDIHAAFESTIQRPQIKEAAEKHAPLSLEQAYLAWRTAVVEKAIHTLPGFVSDRLSVSDNSEVVSQIVRRALPSVEETLPLLLDQSYKVLFEIEYPH